MAPHRARSTLVALGLTAGLLLSACRPSPSSTYSGRATWYTDPSSTGACDLRSGVSSYYVAINSDQFANSEACGGWLKVTGPDGTVTVQVVDRCPSCPAESLDLSPAAFDAIGNPAAGIIRVSWRLVSGGSIGNIRYRVKEGSNANWLGIQVGNIRNLVSTVEIKVGSSWVSLPRQSYNYFVYDSSKKLSSPVTVRATDIWGQHITTTGLAISGGTVKDGGAQFSAH